MKKVVLNYLVIAALVVSAAFTSCNKNGDDDKDEGGATIDKITAKVEGGAKYNGEITTVKLAVDEYTALATGNWNNGGFTIELPKTVDAEYLYTVDYESTVTVSNKNAKQFCAWFIGYDADDGLVDDFWYAKQGMVNNSLTYAEYIYVDSDVNISGTEKYSDEGYEWNFVYSLTLKKGWNITYWVESETEKSGKTVYNGEHKNSTVSGLKWYSSEDLDW